MPSVKVGDRVKIAEREITAADVKSELYYEYFANLVGAVEHVYDDGSASLKIDPASLPEGIRDRHAEVERNATQRWLDGLSQEQRDRLSEKDRLLHLSYSVLVAQKDLEPFSGKIKSPAKPKAEAPAIKELDDQKTKEAEAAQRKSEADIEKAEEEYLRQLAEKANQ
jgi:hypothetical protein